MKKILLALSFVLTFCIAAGAQTIYSCNYKSDADVKVYVTDYKSDADIVICFSTWKSDAGWRRKEKQHLMY